MTRWKWDVDPREPLVALRIPVTSMNPLFPYIAVFDKESAHRPTNAEAKMIRSFIDEGMVYQLTSWERKQSRNQPFDTKDGHDSVVFRKYGTGDWGYRRTNWRIGPPFTPPSPRMVNRSFGPLSLVEVMDLVHPIDDGHWQHWLKWKSEHERIFA